MLTVISQQDSEPDLIWRYLVNSASIKDFIEGLGAAKSGSWIALLERQLQTVIRHSRNVGSTIALDDNTLIDDDEDAKAINPARSIL